MHHHYFTWSRCKCTIIILHGVDVNAPSLVLHETRCKCTTISFTCSDYILPLHCTRPLKPIKLQWPAVVRKRKLRFISCLYTWHGRESLVSRCWPIMVGPIPQSLKQAAQSHFKVTGVPWLCRSERRLVHLPEKRITTCDAFLITARPWWL